jgi:hypothetical protein
MTRRSPCRLAQSSISDRHPHGSHANSATSYFVNAIDGAGHVLPRDTPARIAGILPQTLDPQVSVEGAAGSSPRRPCSTNCHMIESGDAAGVEIANVSDSGRFPDTDVTASQTASVTT